MTNSPDRQGPAFAGHWTECSPNSLYMTDHIGELAVSEGRKWNVAGSLNGLAIFVSTDLSYAAEVNPRHGGTDNRRFMLDTGPLIKELAAELLSPTSPPAALPQDVIHLVIAAREFWDAHNDLSAESRALDKALERFAEKAPYENQPDDANEPSGTGGGDE